MRRQGKPVEIDIPANACSAESPGLSTGLSRRHSRKVTFSSPSLPAEIPRLRLCQTREKTPPPHRNLQRRARSALPCAPYSGQSGAHGRAPPGAAAPRRGKAARRRSPPCLPAPPLPPANLPAQARAKSKQQRREKQTVPMIMMRSPVPVCDKGRARGRPRGAAGADALTAPR